MRVVFVIFAIFLAGCSVKEPNYPSYKSHFPAANKLRNNTFLILPPLNKTTAADATKYASMALATPFVAKGYYVLPVSLTNAFFQTENLSDPEQIHKINIKKLGEIFGVDTVIYPVIHRWDTDYMIISSSVGANIELKAVDVKTGVTLWQLQGARSSDFEGQVKGETLLELAITLAISTTFASINSAVGYFDLAHSSVYEVARQIPYGKYHKNYEEMWDMPNRFSPREVFDFPNLQQRNSVLTPR